MCAAALQWVIQASARLVARRQLKCQCCFLVAMPATAAAAAQAQSKQSADLLDAYRSKVNAAIQAAVSCPLAAQNMGMSGQTKVHFDLTDGVQSNATVATTSKRPMLDSAALAAVQNARYPAPPKEFAGQKKTMSVLVVLNCAN